MNERHIVYNAKTLLFAMVLAITLVAVGGASTFESRWERTYDRIWPGEEYWPNPMEDWQVRAGRLECTSAGGNRNVHVLTRWLTDRRGAFAMSVRLGLSAKGKTGSAGFRIGIHDEINDYRGNLLWGQGVDAGVRLDGTLFVDRITESVANLPLDELTLTLSVDPSGGGYRVTLVAATPSGREMGRVSADVAAERLVGNMALVSNFEAKVRKAARFWFADWKISGEKVAADESRAFGPILWAMHTLSDSRGDDGYVMKMTAQMPPLGARDSKVVELQVDRGGVWKSLGTREIDPDACTATFRVPHWPADRDVPYRLIYTMCGKDGTETPFRWAGTVRKEPRDRPLVFAGLTCQYHYGFPYAPVVKNLTALNPDVMYFSGDQIYEANGHYGIIREPADRAILNYLRKWYLFGWSFGDLMRDRPTLCTPDDHDVFQGNLWGNGGNAVTMERHNVGGYAEPAQMVEVVHRTNTSHHPDLFDDTPMEQGISVLYGDMVYSGVSFAVVSDRMFKSGPRGSVAEWPGRPDHIRDDSYDIRRLDKPGLKLLGERQLKFLEHWVEDWRGADMKMLLSQTLFANVATHHGGHDAYLRADLDSGGWPQSPRNHAIKLARKAFPLHVCGDQHLTILMQYGVDEQRDSNWSLCTPAISVGYQRWWRPDELGRPYCNRPLHGLPHTGEYLDGLDNKAFVYTVGNPLGSRDANRYRQAHIRSSGFSIVRIDHAMRTYTCASYRFLVDVTDGKDDDLFPGFPYTIAQTDNYGREPFGYLQELTCEGTNNPVVKVYDQDSGELLYALRARHSQFRPWVFRDGVFTVKMGDPDKDAWTTFEDLKVEYPRTSQP